MIRLVVDTNILVAAVSRGTVTRRVAETWLNGRTRLLISQDIAEEYLRVLAYPKFHLSPEEVRRIMERVVLAFAGTVENPPRLSVAGVDADDVKFLACGIAGHAHYVVTGDKKLLRLKRYRGIRLITPPELLRIVSKY